MGHLDPKEPTTEVYAKIKRLRIQPLEGKVFGPSGKEIGSPDFHGHIICTVYIGNTQHKIRRPHLIWWAYYGEWPKSLVDHEDRCKTNDKISNLRCRSHLQNMINKKGSGEQSVGVRITDSGQFEAYVKSIFVGVSLGTFDSDQEANAQYLKARTLIAEAIKNVCDSLNASTSSAEARQGEIT